jgi:hypothetical protein
MNEKFGSKKSSKNWADMMYSHFKREGLLDDRSEYDYYDLSSAYPEAKKSDIRQLHKKLKKYRH